MLAKAPYLFCGVECTQPSRIGDSFSAENKIAADTSSLEKHIGLYIAGVKRYPMSTDA